MPENLKNNRNKSNPFKLKEVYETDIQFKNAYNKIGRQTFNGKNIYDDKTFIRSIS